MLTVVFLAGIARSRERADRRSQEPFDLCEKLFLKVMTSEIGAVSRQRNSLILDRLAPMFAVLINSETCFFRYLNWDYNIEIFSHKKIYNFLNHLVVF